MPEKSIAIDLEEVKKIISQFKSSDWPSLYLYIDEEGKITARGMGGRSDLVLNNHHFFFLNACKESEESILYAFKLLVRHKEGYSIKQ